MLRVPAGASVAFEDSANGVVSAKGAGLFTVVTPTRWTAAQRFDDADMILPSLGDPDDPLESAAAAQISAPYLELAKLDALRLKTVPPLKVHEAGS